MAPMYIETVPNRNSPPAILLREGWREGKKTVKRTLANLSDWPASPDRNLAPRAARRDAGLSPRICCTTAHTSPHGHVEAILAMIRQLGLETRDRLQALPRTRSGGGHDRPTADRSVLEVGHHPRLAHHHLGGRVGGGGGHRGRTLRRHGLAAGSARSASRRSWPPVISAKAAWCFTM